MSVLEARELSVRFGGLQALESLSLSVEDWEIVGLIGPNGAGKTTAFNCISGFLRPDHGRVFYCSQDVTTVPPHRRAAMGMARTFQNIGMAKTLSALDNVKTSQHTRTGYSALAGIVGTDQSRTAEAKLTERAEGILDLLGLGEARDTPAGELPYGALKLLELGCALATGGRLLLLDEPSSGLGPEEASQLGDRLLDLRKDLGISILLIEHHVPLVTRVCDYVYVLSSGRLLAEGSPAAIQRHAEVIAAYLGGHVREALADAGGPA